MRKLQAFGAMNGHQLHGVARLVDFERDGAAGLLEVVEIFEEFRQRASFAFWLPVFDKLGKLVDILAVL